MGNMVGGKTEPSKGVTSVISAKRMPAEQRTSTVIGATAAPTEFREAYEDSEGRIDREELAEETEDNNYKEICRSCVIRDIVEENCNHCGLYHLVGRLKLFKVHVTRG